jgi:hypothetical protein
MYNMILKNFAYLRSIYKIGVLADFQFFSNSAWLRERDYIWLISKAIGKSSRFLPLSPLSVNGTRIGMVFAPHPAPNQPPPSHQPTDNRTNLWRKKDTKKVYQIRISYDGSFQYKYQPIFFLILHRARLALPHNSLI